MRQKQTTRRKNTDDTTEPGRGIPPKCFGGEILDPFREIFWGCRAPKYLTEPNIWGLYTPQIFDGTPSVKYLGAVDPPNI